MCKAAVQISPRQFTYKSWGHVCYHHAISLALCWVKATSAASLLMCPRHWVIGETQPAASWTEKVKKISLFSNKLFNHFCLQFSSFLLRCGSITHFGKQDNPRLNRQLPTSPLRSKDFICNQPVCQLYITKTISYVWENRSSLLSLKYIPLYLVS